MHACYMVVLPSAKKSKGHTYTLYRSCHGRETVKACRFFHGRSNPALTFFLFLAKTLLAHLQGVLQNVVVWRARRHRILGEHNLLPTLLTAKTTYRQHHSQPALLAANITCCQFYAAPSLLSASTTYRLQVPLHHLLPAPLRPALCITSTT